MGEQAIAAEAAEPEESVDVAPPESEEVDPVVFNVGDGEEEEKPAETQPETKEEKPKDSQPSEIDELKKQLAEQQAANERQKHFWNKKFYELRQQKKAQKEEPAQPAFTDAQLLKILEEHQGEPAVLLQVMKHMTEGQAKVTEKKAVESAEIKQQVAQTDSWLQTNFPAVFEEESELRGQVDSVKEMMRLSDHPLGNYLAVASTMLASYPEMIKQAREDERKKALAEASETSRKKSVKGAAPAGGKTSMAAAGAADESELIRQAKAMGLRDNAIKTYVQIRKNAAKQSKQVMEA